MPGSNRSPYGGSLVRESGASTVASLFSAQVRVRPDRLAAEDGARQLTYRELDKKSRQLAALLAAQGVERGLT